MNEWQEVPECFGTEGKNNMQCAKCETLHDCLFLRSIKITEKMVGNQIPNQSQAQPTQISIIPMEDTIKQQSTLFWGMYKARIDKLMESGFLNETLTKIQAQGFSHEESFSIMIKII